MEGNLKHISDTIQTSSNSHMVSFQDLTIDNAEAKIIADAISRNQTPKTVSFYNGEFLNDSLNIILESFNTTTKSTELILKGLSNLEQVRKVSEFIKTNNTLHILNLDSNELGDEGFVALSEALSVNSTLTEIRLQSTGMTDDGLRNISEALKVNQGILEIT
jgi:hypothetical protein